MLPSGISIPIKASGGLTILLILTVLSCSTPDSESAPPASVDTLAVQEPVDSLSEDTLSVLQELQLRKSNHFIQVLIDSAEAGDTIVIPPGIYSIDTGIIIDKAITLVGNSEVEITNDLGDIRMVELWASPVSLLGLKLRFAYGPEEAELGYPSIIEVCGQGSIIHVEDCEIDGRGRKGISAEFESSWSCLTLKNNYLHHNSPSAVYGHADYHVPPVSNVHTTFINNRMERNGALCTVIHDSLPTYDDSEYLRIGGFPEELMDPGTKAVWLSVTDKGLAILFQQDDTTFITMHELDMGSNDQSWAIMPGAVYQDGKIFIESGFQDLEFYSYFTYENDRLYFVGHEIENYRLASSDSLESALDRGEPLAAALYYRDYHYFKYPNERCSIVIGMADSVAQALSAAGKHEEAADLIQELAINYWYMTTREAILTHQDFWLTALDYHRSPQRTDELLALCRHLERKAPEFKRLLIPYANALYESGNKRSAIQYYHKFLDSDPESKLPVPEVVWQRLND